MDAQEKHVLPEYTSEANALEHWLNRYRKFLKNPTPEEAKRLFEGNFPPPLKADELAQYLVMRWLNVLKRSANAREQKTALTELRKVLTNMTRLEAASSTLKVDADDPEDDGDHGCQLQ